MNTETHRFKHGEITQKVIGVFFDVFNELGHGFLESVYEKSLELALKRHRHRRSQKNRNPGLVSQKSSR
jgi:GxxExxY protein